MENTGTLTKESFQLFNHLPEVRTKLPANVTQTDLSRIDDDLPPSKGESIARLRNQLGLTTERIERQNRVWTHLEEGELDAPCLQLSPCVLLAPPLPPTDLPPKNTPPPPLLPLPPQVPLPLSIPPKSPPPSVRPESPESPGTRLKRQIRQRDEVRPGKRVKWTVETRLSDCIRSNVRVTFV